MESNILALDNSSRNELKTSFKYKFVSTRQVITTIESAGWRVAKARSVRTNNPYSRHVVEFRRPGNVVAGEYEPRIILINSHDGSSSVTLRAGIFRLVCANGLVVGSDLVPAIRIRHVGYADTKVFAAVDTLIKQFAVVTAAIEKMRATELSDDARLKFAAQAVTLRNGAFGPVSAALLTCVRDADKGRDLWSTFNVIQENLIKGRFLALVEPGRRNARYLRELRGVTSTVEVNQKLWALAETFLTK